VGFTVNVSEMKYMPATCDVLLSLCVIFPPFSTVTSLTDIGEVWPWVKVPPLWTVSDEPEKSADVLFWMKLEEEPRTSAERPGLKEPEFVKVEDEIVREPEEFTVPPEAFVTSRPDQAVVVGSVRAPPLRMERVGRFAPPPESVVVAASVYPLGITYFDPLDMVTLSYVWEVVTAWVVFEFALVPATLPLSTTRSPFVAEAAFT
jgi:hypothetical protein